MRRFHSIPIFLSRSSAGGVIPLFHTILPGPERFGDQCACVQSQSWIDHLRIIEELADVFHFLNDRRGNSSRRSVSFLDSQPLGKFDRVAFPLVSHTVTSGGFQLTNGTSLPTLHLEPLDQLMVAGQVVNLPEVSMSGSRAHEHCLAMWRPKIRTLLLLDGQLDYLLTSSDWRWPGTRPQLDGGSLVLLGLVNLCRLRRNIRIIKS